jgi:hypothetical protein
VAIANGDVTVTNLLTPVTCTLRFGSTVMETFTYHFDLSPVEAVLQGAGGLTSGSITLSCEGSGNTASGLSLIAYVVSAIN